MVENTPKTREMQNFQNFDQNAWRFVLINDPKSCQIFQILYGNAKMILRETKIKMTFSGPPQSQHFSSWNGTSKNTKKVKKTRFFMFSRVLTKIWSPKSTLFVLKRHPKKSAKSWKPKKRGVGVSLGPHFPKLEKNVFFYLGVYLESQHFSSCKSKNEFRRNSCFFDPQTP